MQKATFEELMMQLTDDQTPRVWSLLVTVFGELAQETGARIEGALLSRLTALMGIKPEAVRVALHRLRKDGWVQSERSGRTSTYSLTERGRVQSAKATPRIYGLHPLPEQAWLVLFDPGQPVPDHAIDGAWIASNLLITAAPGVQNQALVSPILTDQFVPDWMRHKVCNPETVQLTQDFLSRVEQLQDAIKHVGTLDCFEISAMRILIVDRWRRIALKTPHLPVHVFPDAWAGLACRNIVASLLGSYPKQNLDDLKAAL